MARLICWMLLVSIALLSSPGCTHLAVAPWNGVVTGELPFSNPIHLPASDAEFLWNQLVDTTDDYFKIKREDRMNLIGGVVTEGRIETFPVIGATIFEPWRRDSVGAYARLEATLQTIRRWATVRVVPIHEGYSVEIAVFKQLEHLDQPANSSLRTRMSQMDDSQAQDDGDVIGARLGWIPQGRDVLLEQQMLAELHGRVVGGEPPVSMVVVRSANQTP